MKDSFFAPSDLTEALGYLSSHGEERIVLAGGTDLWPKWNISKHRPQNVLSLHRLTCLREIQNEGSVLRIGSMASHRDLIRSSQLQNHVPSLVQSARTIGACQIQNQGTIGGNVMNASPAADLPPPLAAAEAKLEFRSANSIRTLPIETFYLGYRIIDRKPDELLTAVLIPTKPPRTKDFFWKLGTRQAQAISKVVGSMRVELEPDGSIARAVLAFGSIAPTMIRLIELETWLRGRYPDFATAMQAAEMAQALIRPIDDIRSTAQYRTHIVGRMVYRGLLSLQVD